ncbi:Ubiquinone biosynthesis O-methyltransferase [Pandoraea horticolens]|uniref:Ubiquinone biosynthesis O-methyltransferase n=1 Tax=Pandoraea horticolens TaxID=2508298 RepID=A0A5E4V338_9BURK|nr:Ubiquinone biosynthesis O-methyltransferase [Pandoraea horticolens]
MTVATSNVDCPLCGTPTSHTVLNGRPDYEYGVKRALTYRQCSNGGCGLIFVKPLPTLAEVSTFYQKYSTHTTNDSVPRIPLLSSAGESSGRRALAALFGGARLGTLSVLDYGCGGGAFMSKLTSLGVGQVTGYDFDPEACQNARTRGLNVLSSEDEVSRSGPYDFIFLNHVIEHLIDPIGDIQRISAYLKVGGKLVLRTPNTQSTLCRLFGANWRGWETPRHLHLFSMKSLIGLVEAADTAGLRAAYVSTSNAMFLGMYHESFHTRCWRAGRLGKLVRHALSYPVFLLSTVNKWFTRYSGEELCLVVEKVATK